MGGDEGASPAEEGQGRGAHRAQDYGGGTAQGTRRAPGMCQRAQRAGGFQPPKAS